MSGVLLLCFEGMTSRNTADTASVDSRWRPVPDRSLARRGADATCQPPA